MLTPLAKLQLRGPWGRHSCRQRIGGQRSMIKGIRRHGCPELIPLIRQSCDRPSIHSLAKSAKIAKVSRLGCDVARPTIESYPHSDSCILNSLRIQLRVSLRSLRERLPLRSIEQGRALVVTCASSERVTRVSGHHDLTRSPPGPRSPSSASLAEQGSLAGMISRGGAEGKDERSAVRFHRAAMRRGGVLTARFRGCPHPRRSGGCRAECRYFERHGALCRSVHSIAPAPSRARRRCGHNHYTPRRVRTTPSSCCIGDALVAEGTCKYGQLFG